MLCLFSAIPHRLASRRSVTTARRSRQPHERRMFRGTNYSEVILIGTKLPAVLQTGNQISKACAVSQELSSTGVLRQLDEVAGAISPKPVSGPSHRSTSLASFDLFIRPELAARRLSQSAVYTTAAIIPMAAMVSNESRRCDIVIRTLTLCSRNSKDGLSIRPTNNGSRKSAQFWLSLLGA
jgi:hypothetical protein